MKVQNKIFTGAIATLAMTTSIAHAGEATHHSGQSLEHTAQAIGHLSVGTAKAASGIVAIPFGAVGKAGELSEQASHGMSEFANKPLDIGDEIITVGPTPAQMFQRDQEI